jgi:predicted PurR-regulated permease PerM
VNGDVLSARQAYAAAQWHRLSETLRTVTPRGVGRVALTFTVATMALWLAVGTWPAALPFLIGGIAAYVLLPVVDTLDRFMPRGLAALVSVLGTAALIIAVVLLILPPLAITFVRFSAELPTAADIDAAVERIQANVAALPEGSAAFAVPLVATLATAVRDLFANAGGNLDSIVETGVQAILQAIGAILGLIVLPTWVLVLLRNKQVARRALDSEISPGWRGDAWAVVGIVDRAAGAYTRGYVVAGALVGLLVYLGTQLSPRIGGPTFSEPVVLALFAAITYLVPIIGPLLGLIPALLILPLSPERAVAYLVIYIAARLIGGTLLGARLMERRLGVHPAILVPGVVMLGQLGIIWLLLSAPIVAIAVDLVRYVHGRLSDPPMPAGVLPRTQAAAARAPSARRVSSIYRPTAPPPPIRRAPVGAPSPLEAAEAAR